MKCAEVLKSVVVGVALAEVELDVRVVVLEEPEEVLVALEGGVEEEEVLEEVAVDVLRRADRQASACGRYVCLLVISERR